VRALDRRACRRQAEQRFDLRQTTRQYLDLYRELSAESALPLLGTARHEGAASLELPR
jgi:hypothetical protein